MKFLLSKKEQVFLEEHFSSFLDAVKYDGGFISLSTSESASFASELLNRFPHSEVALGLARKNDVRRKQLDFC